MWELPSGCDSGCGLERLRALFSAGAGGWGGGSGGFGEDSWVVLLTGDCKICWDCGAIGGGKSWKRSPAIGVVSPWANEPLSWIQVSEKFRARERD